MHKIFTESEGEIQERDDSHDRKRWKKIAQRIAIAMLLLVFLVGIGGFVYWQYLKTTPQYAIASLIDASRRGDKQEIDRIIDTDRVVDDFVPQIVEKAIELFGRGISKSVIDRISQIATPFMPAVKKRVKQNLPRMLRARTQKFENIPFPAIVVGANRYLEISYEGNDTALVKSLIKDKPLDLKMEYDGSRWRVVAVEDEKIATQLAQRYGQQIITLAQSRGEDGINKLGERLGIRNLSELINGN